uniref:Uncharacterized protein n=1 Tax=viral metagenome TaxID=1070528 RepID=A0A6C0HGC4_9ZZZZ
MDNAPPITKTILYSFTAGYMVSQLNILGFAMGCGFMMALHYIPEDIKKFNLDIYNNVIYIIGALPLNPVMGALPLKPRNGGSAP